MSTRVQCFTKVNETMKKLSEFSNTSYAVISHLESLISRPDFIDNKYVIHYVLLSFYAIYILMALFCLYYRHSRDETETRPNLFNIVHLLQLTLLKLTKRLEEKLMEFMESNSSRMNSLLAQQNWAWCKLEKLNMSSDNTNLDLRLRYSHIEALMVKYEPKI